MLIGVGGSYRLLYSFVSYLYVRCSGSITSVREERANFFRFCLLSVRRGFSFLMGCVILLLDSLGLSYDLFLEHFEDLLNIDNPYFEGMVNQNHPLALQWN